MHTKSQTCPFIYSRTPLIRINWDGEPSGYAENPDNWTFFKNKLHWQFEVEKLQTDGCLRLHIYLQTNKTLKHKSLCAFENWGKN
jgi:hypothetical protein